MEIKITPAELKDIQAFRALFLQELNHQFICHSFHQRGWAYSYLCSIDNIAVGYGSLCSSQKGKKDTVFEFYILPVFRKFSNAVFKEFLATSGALLFSCQSNDLLLTSILYEFGQNIHTDVVLFEDHISTRLEVADVMSRRKAPEDKMFDHKSEPPGDYVLELNNEIVATAGFLLHYNAPFADLYMEVRADCRGKGYASFLLQEVKKECYLAGRVPAARCNIRNVASKATLLKAGLKVCGYELAGSVKDEFKKG